MPNESALWLAGWIAAWVGSALLLGWLSGVVLRWSGRRREHRSLRQLYRCCHRPWELWLLCWALYNALSPAGAIGGTVHHVLLLALIGTTAWLVVRFLYIVEDAAFHRLRVDVVDNRRVRRARTQIGILRRLTSALITLLSLGAMLMTFDGLRALGASLLASAGVAGAVAGLAAQTILRNVLAGAQLALTDQLRIDDVVVVEQEWGRVEELTLTHVVLRLWDERRLMLPTTYFITTPFQNWTRDESRVVGAVPLHLNYTAPVPELRAAAQRIVEASPLWDRREWVFQVVDSTPWSMVVRVLASAADGPSSWDLRCEIRERLIAFLVAEHPDALPDRGRADLPPATGPDGSVDPATQVTGGADLGFGRSDGARPPPVSLGP
jgi:small-conductance mechanosensitive channel